MLWMEKMFFLWKFKYLEYLKRNFSLQIILIRYRALGAEEEARLRAEYEEQGKEEEKKVSRK